MEGRVIPGGRGVAETHRREEINEYAGAETECCYGEIGCPRAGAGVLTQAICRRSWRNTLAVLARRGRRYGGNQFAAFAGNRAERFLAGLGAL